MAEAIGGAPSQGAPGAASNSANNQQATGQQEAPVAPDFRGTKHKVKVYDREQEIDYDELVNGYQLRQASHKALQDASTVRKQAESFLDSVKSKDRKALAQAFGGEDALKAFAEELLLDDLEQRSLPEPERRARAAEAKAKELEDWKKSQEKEREDQQRTQAERQAGEQLDGEITEAFTEFGSKPTPYLVARVADEMAARLEHGKAITAKQALSIVEKSMQAELSEIPPEKLFPKLSPAHIEYIRKQLVDQHMSQQPRRVRAPEGQRTTGEPRKPMTIEEAFEAKQKSLARR